PLSPVPYPRGPTGRSSGPGMTRPTRRFTPRPPHHAPLAPAPRTVPDPAPGVLPAARPDLLGLRVPHAAGDLPRLRLPEPGAGERAGRPRRQRRVGPGREGAARLRRPRPEGEEAHAD